MMHFQFLSSILILPDSFFDSLSSSSGREKKERRGQKGGRTEKDESSVIIPTNLSFKNTLHAPSLSSSSSLSLSSSSFLSHLSAFVPPVLLFLVPIVFQKTFFVSFLVSRFVIRIKNKVSNHQMARCTNKRKETYLKVGRRRERRREEKEMLTTVFIDLVGNQNVTVSKKNKSRHFVNRDRIRSILIAF